MDLSNWLRGLKQTLTKTFIVVKSSGSLYLLFCLRNQRKLKKSQLSSDVQIERLCTCRRVDLKSALQVFKLSQAQENNLNWITTHFKVRFQNGFGFGSVLDKNAESTSHVLYIKCRKLFPTCLLTYYIAVVVSGLCSLLSELGFVRSVKEKGGQKND